MRYNAKFQVHIDKIAQILYNIESKQTSRLLVDILVLSAISVCIGVNYADIDNDGKVIEVISPKLFFETGTARGVLIEYHF